MFEKKENRVSFEARVKLLNLSQDAVDDIMFAYQLSKTAHRIQKRDTGERYFEHPRAGCLILLDELKYGDPATIIAFLLHDTGEDTFLWGDAKTDYRLFQKTASHRLTKYFGSEVARLVIALTKPGVDGIIFKTNDEVLDYYINSMEEEPKAKLNKMVDRLHNLRSLTKDMVEKILKTIKETEELYMPHFITLTQDEIFGRHATYLLQQIKLQIEDLKEMIKYIIYYASDANYDGDGYADPVYYYFLTYADVEKQWKLHLSPKQITVTADVYEKVKTAGGYMVEYS
jgi:hypothetical protein